MAILKHNWRWSELGEDTEPFKAEILDLASPYESSPPPFCYPGMLLPPEIVSVGASLLGKQFNAIGTHTHGLFDAHGNFVASPGEKGFEEIQSAERDAVWMIASVLGGSPQEIDGYFCGGGTEANLEGLWIGREVLTSMSDSGVEDVAVLISPLTHYSVQKAAFLLGFGRVPLSHCSLCGRLHVVATKENGRGIQFVGVNDRGEMDIGDFARMIDVLYQKGVRKFLVVPTVGTTILGSIDPVHEMSLCVKDFSLRHKDAQFFIHVDASFGGFTVPFVAPELPLWFQNPEVQSIALDADKMGHLPYPAGIFLCRKDLQKYVSRHVAYVGGHNDDTVSGSRSAVAPLLARYYYPRLGLLGQRVFVERCLWQRDKLTRLIEDRFASDARVQLFPRSSWTNFMPIEINISNGEIPKEALFGPILRPYALHSDLVPTSIGGCPRTVYKICVMPQTFSSLDCFVDDLAAVLAHYEK